ncbi:MAG TPA: ABC transporter ATP-binding protein [Candidatus Woesebacteria bacterium]|jgi:ATP-binding cassette subfamily B protein|nr:ABC transporter ATP-binding protein [Candidatus Shapirobacteria bacterium]HOR02167.1 ABC transporter ATP-binding protein [Candidatus Woesebacteria bacterium]
MKDKTKKTLQYYWEAMKNHKTSGLVLTAAVVLGSILDTIIPILSKNFFDILFDGGVKEEIVKSLIGVLVLMGVFKLVRWLLWRVASFSMNFFESRTMVDLSRQGFDYLQKHSFSYFSNNFPGSIVKKHKSFINTFEFLTDQLFFEIVPGVVSVTVMIFVLGQINVFLGWGMLGWMVLFLLINWLFVKYKLKYDLQRSEAETATSGLLADTVSNNFNIKLFNGYIYESEAYGNLSEVLHKIRKFTWDMGAVFYGAQSFLMLVFEILIYYLAVRWWQRDLLTVGDFVLIQSYLFSAVMMVWDFGRIMTRVYERLAEAEEMTEILSLPHGVVDNPKAKKLKIKSGGIRFEEVGFRYEEGEKVVKDFNLEVKPGQMVALVGLSGSGKSTLAKLLLRLYDVDEGRILVDGQNIAKVSQESLRKNISLVPQDPILFHRSLMENIRYGRFEASDKEVIGAAKLAYCDGFISKLKDGYQSMVGDRGIKLSGGERQRVAIARAILKNSPILVLDEATSSLDSESEKYIQKSLNNLMKGKTVIVIAHRLSTIKRADRIVVISDKKIVEDGNHNQLIKAKSGIYKKLWKIQVGGFIKY